MKVKIGNVIIPDATVKRFIDLESGLPLSMIKVTYTQEVENGELIEAFKSNTSVSFECDILKTPRVLVHGFGYNRETNIHHCVLQEWGADVSCGYKSVDWTQPTGNIKMVFIIPEDVKDVIDPYELSLLPYKRFILKKDIPKEWLK